MGGTFNNAAGGGKVRRKSTLVLAACMVLAAIGQRLHGNELQRLVFNAAGNIGVTEAIVEFQGITPGNSPTINNYINTAITMLNQLISRYNDPPFESDQIRKIVTMLERFPVATARMNNQGRATYLQNCFTNLKSAMSTIFRSDLGLKYNATCDTFVATLGYNTGKAMAGIMINNRFLENEGRSGINIALSSGTRTRDTLGCSFLTADQIRALDIQNRRTSAEFAAMLRELENDVLVASLNMEPGFDSPATKGTVIRPIDPPPPAEENQSAVGLVGRWQANGDSTQINFVQEGPKIRGYIYNLHRYRVEEGYRENELVIEVTRISDRNYTGSFLYKHVFRGRATITWTPARIEIYGADRFAKIAYILPGAPADRNPEDHWYYQRKE